MKHKESPITFVSNVVIPGDVGSRFIAAGEPSPFKTLSEVPPNLRDLVGTPDASWPRSTPNQYWTPREVLENEREAIEALNDGADLPETVREELAARNEQYLRDSAARSQVESQIAQRDLEEVARIKREKELEADELLEAQGLISKRRKL